MQNCFQNTVREATNIADFYPGMSDHEPLLICNKNINDRERVNKRLLETSVLLKGENLDLSSINNSFDDRLYSRNVPAGDFIVNVEPRPLPSDPCADIRFQKERDSLDRYNFYKAPETNKQDEQFLPQKGTVKRYFDNVDMESELKNINQIDTKCSLQLFKTHPLDSKSSLYKNKDFLIKNYKELEENNGYTWNNFNQYSSLNNFNSCQQKEIECPIQEKTLERKLVTDPNIKTSGQIVTHPTVTTQHQIRELQNQQRDAENIINMEQKPQMMDMTPKIRTYESSGVQNIYAPIIKKEGINQARATARGMRDAAEVALRNPTIIRQMDKRNNCFNPVEIYNLDEQVDLSKYNCIKENQKLYTFNIPNIQNEDCQYCEKLFNNHTKRKIITPSKQTNLWWTRQKRS